jgi:hypothetical protein
MNNEYFEEVNNEIPFVDAVTSVEEYCLDDEFEENDFPKEYLFPRIANGALIAFNKPPDALFNSFPPYTKVDNRTVIDGSGNVFTTLELYSSFAYLL